MKIVPAINPEHAEAMWRDECITVLTRIADASERIAAEMERHYLTMEGTINNTHLV